MRREQEGPDSLSYFKYGYLNNLHHKDMHVNI